MPACLHHDRSPVCSRGIALILVIVVLMALLLIATPFAVSMKDHRVVTTMNDGAVRSHEDLRSVVNLVSGRLAVSHPNQDPSPDVDGNQEIDQAAAFSPDTLMDGARNPRGSIWSARVEDEQAKLDLNGISPFTLANLLGSRTVLADKVSDAATEIPVEDSSIFDSEGGWVVVDAELIHYQGVTLGALTGCERGVNAVDEEPARFAVTESFYFCPGSLVRITDGVRTDYGLVSRTVVGRRDLFTGRGGRLEITHGFTPAAAHAARSPVIDARAFAVHIYRILRQPGACYRYPTVSAIRQITDLGLAGFDPSRLERVLPYLTVFARHEGAARWGNARTILDNFTYRQVDWLGDRTWIEYEVRYPVNLNTATKPVLRALLVGLHTERDEEWVTEAIADKLVERIETARTERPLESAEDFLDRVLTPAQQLEEITRNQRDAVFQNFFDSPMLTFLKGGTHRAVFHSLDTYSITAAVSRNNAAGVEIARRRAREVVSVAPPRLLTFGLDSQWDFEKQVLPGRYCRFVTTYPVSVEHQQSPQDPPIFDPPNRSRKQLSGYARNLRRESRGQETRDVFASRLNEGTEGEDAGSVRYRPARSADGIRTMRGTEPTRYPVEHFDNHDEIDGMHLESGVRQVRLGSMRGRFGGRGGRGASNTRPGPRVIGLWYQPRWDDATQGRRYIWGSGLEPTSNKMELYYDGEEHALVLEVADTGLNREEDLSRVYFPIALQRNTWYQLAAVVAGTRPDQLQILVDGVPYRGTQTEKNRQRYRFLTHLTGELDASETSIQVEDTTHFPERGVLIIGEERIEYQSKTKTTFRALSHDGTSTVVRRGRGARGSEPVTHVMGAAVLLYGYGNALQSDLPQTGGHLAGVPDTFGRWRPAMLAGTDRITTVRGAPAGLLDTSTTIPLVAAGGGTLEGFQQSGLALLCSARIQRQGPDPTPQNPNPAGVVEMGGVELIHYQTLAGNELQGVTRGVTTPLLTKIMKEEAASLLNPTLPKVFLNGTESQLQVQAENGTGILPTWVIPVSVQVSTIEKWLDPVTTGFSERVQINDGGTGIPEWVRYDERLALNGGAFLARTQWPHLLAAFRQICRRAITLPTSSGGQDTDGTTGATNGSTTSTEAQEAQETFLGPVADTEVAEGLGKNNWLEFRGSDGTEDQAHPKNTEVIQVFRTELPGAGPDDHVTIVNGTGETRATHLVRWGAAYRNADLGAVARSGVHFASFRANVAHGWVSDTTAMRNQTNRNPAAVALDTVPRQIQWDTRRVTRILKAPSGELPARGSDTLTVGGTFGGNHAPCVVDEIETFDQNEALVRRIFLTPARKMAYDAARNPAATEEARQKQREAIAKASRVVSAEETNITLALANVWNDFDGLVKEREMFRGSVALVGTGGTGGGRRGQSGGFAYTRRSRDDQDAGLVRIGEEFVVYRGVDTSGAAGLVLKDCTRGAFGSEAAAHEQGEAVLFLSYVELTLLAGEVSAEASRLSVANTLGFSPQGYVAIFDDVQAGSVREIVGYTETRGGGRQGGASEFIMPEKVTTEKMKEILDHYAETGEVDPESGGPGMLRGRYGTLPSRHATNAVVLRLPFRYWDRAAKRADHPALGFYQVPVHRPGAFFKRIDWGEHFPKPHLDVRVLARVDQRTSWAAEPQGKANGLFEFLNPRSKNDANRIDMQGDLLEVRVFFDYRAGAFTPFFEADGWKETPWLTRLGVDYVQPTMVLHHEALR